MSYDAYFIVTGGAGLIGSNLIEELNQRGHYKILIVDHLGSSEKWKNLTRLRFLDYIEKDTFIKSILKGRALIGSPDFKYANFIHLGACSSTTETNASYLIENNFHYTKILCEYAIQQGMRFLYASSAATYGLGEFGYSEDNLESLKPLNMYGYSKHLFDLYAHRRGLFDKIIGVKYFNVFGYGEAHKGDMRSVVLKGYEQIKNTGKLSLFKSYHPNYKDGEQKRDFLYVKDAVKMTLHLLNLETIYEEGGLYNIGRGIAETWLDLAHALFKAMGKEPNIEFIDMPDYLKPKYQYYTCADMSRFLSTGYSRPFTSLEEAIQDYVNLLEKEV